MKEVHEAYGLRFFFFKILDAMQAAIFLGL
jgi:hypothetical protein